jgi:hypothetical protein
MWQISAVDSSSTDVITIVIGRSKAIYTSKIRKITAINCPGWVRNGVGTVAEENVPGILIV